MHPIDFRKVIPERQENWEKFNITNENKCYLPDGYYEFKKTDSYPSSANGGTAMIVLHNVAFYTYPTTVPLQASGPASGYCRKVANFEIKILPL